MFLQILWFILIAVLYIVYLFLDGIDFGTGMLLPFLTKDDQVRGQILRTIGPHWGANEVWLLTAGGATFAAFPLWYATMFSGMYIALFLLLAALIVRGVSIEYRNNVESPAARKALDFCIAAGDFLPPLLLAVALSSLLQGLPIDGGHVFTGSLLSLFSPLTLLSGLSAVAFFVYHGAVELELRMPDSGLKLKPVAAVSGIVVLVLAAGLFLAAVIQVNLLAKPLSAVLLALGIAAFAVSYFVKRAGKAGASLILNAVTIVCAVGGLFAALFPNVMISSTSAANSLTVYNSSSSQYTLRIMTAVTCVLLPIVIAYTAWSYWLFARKSAEKSSSAEPERDAVPY